MSNEWWKKEIAYQIYPKSLMTLMEMELVFKRDY